MPSTYTSLLRLEDQANGENDTTWGNIADSNFLMVEHAIAGRAAVTHDDTANYTLTTANNSADEARRMILNIGGALTAARNTVCPTSSKVYVAKNATTGGFATTLKTTAGTGISIPNGKTTLLFCDGTNVVSAIDYLPALQVGGTFTFTPANASATLSPTGTGTVTINPATAGAMNNMVIGGSTPEAGTFSALTATGTFVAANGAVGTPSIQFAAGATTGFWSIAATIIGVATGATERARFTAEGYFKASVAGTYSNATGAYHELRGNAADYMARFANTNATSPNGFILEYTAAAPNGTANSFFIMVDNAATRIDLRSNGGIANFSANDVNLSDASVKHIERPAGSYLDFIRSLNLVEGFYLDEMERHGAAAKRHTMLVAQDVQRLAPELVVPFSGEKLGVLEHDVQMRHLRATQELVLRTDEHEEDIEALKAWRGRAETALAANGITVH